MYWAYSKYAVVNSSRNLGVWLNDSQVADGLTRC